VIDFILICEELTGAKHSGGNTWWLIICGKSSVTDHSTKDETVLNFLIFLHTGVDYNFIKSNIIFSQIINFLTCYFWLFTILYYTCVVLSMCFDKKKLFNQCGFLSGAKLLLFFTDNCYKILSDWANFSGFYTEKRRVFYFESYMEASSHLLVKSLARRYDTGRNNFIKS
jgi:hypothetical protein